MLVAHLAGPEGGLEKPGGIRESRQFKGEPAREVAEDRPLDENVSAADHSVQCGVCNQVTQGVDVDELESAGWVVEEELCLCADCVGRGWRPPFDRRIRRRRFSRA